MGGRGDDWGFSRSFALYMAKWFFHGQLLKRPQATKSKAKATPRWYVCIPGDRSFTFQDKLEIGWHQLLKHVVNLPRNFWDLPIPKLATTRQLQHRSQDRLGNNSAASVVFCLHHSPSSLRRRLGQCKSC